jgi:Raf kinase inhibitor-like YbhB/YbcL family protein
MYRRSPLALSSALCVSLFAAASLLSSCSSDEGGDGTQGGAAGTGGTTGGTQAKGGSSGASGSASGGTAGGTGGSASGNGGSAGSKAGGGTGGSASGAAGAGGSGGTTGGGAGGATGGAGTTGGSSAGGSGGATGGAGAGGAGGATGGTGTGGSAGGSGGSAGGGSGKFELTSPAFNNVEGCSPETPTPCERFPDENIWWDDNDNISPALNWANPPSGTLSFAVVLHDLSTNPINVHWVIWNIDGAATGLPAGVDDASAMPDNVEGAQQANFLTGDGYFGPGSECNVYQFVVYALAVDTFTPNMATNSANVKMQLDALDDDILGTATLTGRSNYEMTCQD